MRLSEQQVNLICQKVLLSLHSKKAVQFKKNDTEILHRMKEIFLKELRVEDDIDKEAHSMLKQYESKMGGNIDREKMLQMIKKQLLKDKKVVT